MATSGRRIAGCGSATSPPISGSIVSRCSQFRCFPIMTGNDSRFSVTPRLAGRMRRRMRIKGYADGWRSIQGMSDEEAAQQNPRGPDRYSGRSDDAHVAWPVNWSLPASRRPVQAAWLAYPGTTGIAAMDYRLTDPWLDPPGSRSISTPKSRSALPDTFWCYDPLCEEMDAGRVARFDQWTHHVRLPEQFLQGHAGRRCNCGSVFCRR